MADETSSSSSSDLLLGYASLLISCAAFGFMFAPLKRMDARDGVFVQWVQCAIVFMAGFIINICQGLPPFNLVAAIGGFLYATGNVASVPIVGEMGIGLGMLIWGSVQIIVGWCVAHFGLFGTKPQQVDSPLLNYLGVVLTLASGLMFVFVYSQDEEDNTAGKEGQKTASSNAPLNAVATERIPQTEAGVERGPYGAVVNVWAVHTTTQQNPGRNNESEAAGSAVENGGVEPGRPETTSKPNYLPWAWARALHLTKRKLFFIGLAICLGSLHGLMMTPIVYVQDTDEKASKNVLDYVFSQFSAIFFFSTLYFALYSLIKRGRPYVKRGLVLSAMVYGVLWTLGMTLFIISNQKLSQTVSFPITVRFPAIIGALADVFLFKTITGKKQLLYLFAAIAVGLVGVILVGISLVT